MSEKMSTKNALREHLTQRVLSRDADLLTELSNLAPKDCELVVPTSAFTYRRSVRFEIFEL
jgi:hypothetical protein